MVESSTGFEHDALSDIAEIKGIVRDQYDAQSIVKELVQNADDAGARELHLALLTGAAEAKHPLLSAPGLVVLNNGEFAEKDERGIRRIRVGSKGADLKSIGKFGLGLKSIFHLCEAFFYFASPEQPAAGGSFSCTLLNPWKGTGIHDEWDEMQDARELIEGSIGRWEHGLKPFFGLWVPLRRVDDLNGKDPIRAEFPDGVQLFHSKLNQQVPVLFPLLHSLERVKFWGTDEDGVLSIRRCFELTPGTNRALGAELPTADTRSISGTVSSSGGNHSDDLIFRGMETMVDDVYLMELQKGDWPSIVTIDRETGKSIMVREKATPHAAVVFARSLATGAGRLAISRAVFLPLVSEIGVESMKGKHNYHLLLHASYFLDAGRKDIFTATDEAPSVEALWNQALEGKGTFPLLLPALDYFVQELELTDLEVHDLTYALLRSSVIKDRLPTVCERLQWIYRLHKGGAKWELLQSDRPVRILPRPPTSDSTIAFQVFPKLEEVTQSVAVTYAGSPRLARQEPVEWAEDSDALLEYATAQSVFGDQKRLNYFNEFLSQEREELGDVSWQKIIAIARSALSSTAADELKKIQKPLTEFIRLLPTERWLSVPSVLVGREDGLIFRNLCSLPLSCLLIPEGLVAEGGHARLSMDEINMCMEMLTGLPVGGASWKDTCSSYALYLLDRTAGSLDAKRARCGEFQIFRIHGYKTRRDEFLSWNDLENLRAANRLFRGGQFCDALQKALNNDQVYRLVDFKNSASTILFGENELADCDRTASIHVLKLRPMLSKADRRVDLLKKLTQGFGAGADGDDYQAVRYLLHGYREIVATDTPLYVTAEDGRVWFKVVASVLKHGGQPWRLISDSLSSQLSPEVRSCLNLVSVSSTTAEELLVQTGSNSLQQVELTLTEREEILREIRNQALWRALPLHTTISGELIPIDERTFLGGTFPLPDELKSKVTLLRTPDEEGLGAIYKERVPRWNEEAAIEVALGQPEPWRYWRIILDSLPNVDERQMARLTQLLYEAEWLPTTHGPRSPANVVHIAGLEDVLTRVLSDAALSGSFIDLKSLAPEVQEHSAFEIVRNRLVLDPKRSLAALGRCLSDLPLYWIGDMPELDSSTIDSFLSAFANRPPEELIGYGLLKDARAALAGHREVAALLPSLLKPVPLSLIRSCLESLADICMKREVEGTSSKEVFLWYLRRFLGSPQFKLELLRGLKLSNRRGGWKPAEKLALEDRGAGDSDLLDLDLAEILAPMLNDLAERRSSTSSLKVIDRPPSVDEAAGVRAIENYFRTWEGHVPREVIGGFLALLGNHNQIQKLANEYLVPKWSVQQIRERLALKYLDPAINSRGETIDDLMKTRRFLIKRSTSSRVTVENLFGEPMQVNLGKRFNHLFVGDLRPRLAVREKDAFVSFAELYLREITPSSLGRDDLVQVLCASAHLVLKDVYRRAVTNLNDLFDQLAESDQTDLALSQRLILKNAFFYFRQLHGPALGKLRSMERDWDSLSYKEEAGSLGKETIEREREKLLRTLQERLETDIEVQQKLLRAVRTKVEQYRYQPDSIPFELFQNADDAAIELAEMTTPSKRPPLLDQVTVFHDHQTLSWLHWGRPINHFQKGDFSAERGLQRGFQRDLDKMLILSSSDKSPAESSVTGKFGLGFKSVFLICDQPQVLSGRLGFRVVAGLFPIRLSDDDRARLGDRLAQSADKSEGTIFELNCREDVSLTEVLSRFRNQAHLLLVFSRKIKVCELVAKEGVNRETLSWRESPIFGSQRIFAGELRPSQESRLGHCFALVVRARSSSALLFEIGPRGFRKFKAEIPTFWVTTPTNHYFDVGFAINGAFALDVGRSQLDVGRSQFAQDPSNSVVVRELGESLGEALIELFEHADNWESLKEELRFATDLEPNELWESVWNLFSAAEITRPQGFQNDARTLVREIVWANDAGITRLLQEKKALPTGLSGRYRTLARMQDVTIIVEGSLSEPDLFCLVVEFEEFQAKVRPGEAISKPVAQRLEDVGRLPEHAKHCRLADFFKWVLQSSRDVSPSRARKLGLLFSTDTLKKIGEDRLRYSEENDIKEAISEFRFRGWDNLYHRAEELVISTLNDDEARRTVFAPPSRVLDRLYDDDGIEFFKRCRKSLTAPAGTLVGWGLDASTTEQRHGFLRYLLEGDLAHNVASLLRDMMVGSWMEDIQTSDLLDEFEESEQILFVRDTWIR